jgi:hypothetical protein
MMIIPTIKTMGMAFHIRPGDLLQVHHTPGTQLHINHQRITMTTTATNPIKTLTINLNLNASLTAAAAVAEVSSLPSSPAAVLASMATAAPHAIDKPTAPPPS